MIYDYKKEIDNKKVDPELMEQYDAIQDAPRRKGGGFDTMAKILRNITMAVFRTGTVISDRPGHLTAAEVTNPANFVKSKSVFEIYQQKEPLANEYNLMFIGRNGDGNYTNTNYIEITADSKSNEISVGNGQAGFKLSRDGVGYDRAIIALQEGANEPALGGPGARVMLQGQGISGGVQLAWYDENDVLQSYFVLDKDGIQIGGLPTSAPADPGKLWSNGGVLTVT